MVVLKLICLMSVTVCFLLTKLANRFILKKLFVVLPKKHTVFLFLFSADNFSKKISGVKINSF